MKPVYTPVSIFFMPLLLWDNDEVINAEGVANTMLIESVSSKSLGKYQVPPSRLALKIPYGGKLRFKLLTTDQEPRLRYKVTYYKDSQIAYDTQYWAVPKPPVIRTIKVIGSTWVLPEDFYHIIEVSPATEYFIDGDSLRFDDTVQEHVVQYQPAVTLDQLVVDV